VTARASKLVGGRDRRKWRDLATPEGVPLAVRVGDSGKRIKAFLLDAFIIYCSLLIAHVVFMEMMGGSERGMGIEFFQLSQFLLLNFYFVFFELRWQGATPGKRATGLRVIDRSGGPLSAQAVVARNLVRDIELVLPIVILVDPDGFWPGAPKAVAIVASIWAILCALMPLFNRDRLRIGDLVAGTIVITEPKTVLLPDLGATPVAHYAADPAQPADPAVQPVAAATFSFSEAQLDVYGVYELQVLERVLREQSNNVQALDIVCDKVKRKIGWPNNQWHVPSEVFLTDFYRAMRAHLERQMLFGKRRENKHDTTSK
jgi:uncharacterized RDD family membrane protein YckC